MSDYLLRECLIDIFKTLEPKTLIRCATVCKSWHSLITSPLFIAEHIKYGLIKCQENKAQTIPTRHCNCNFYRDEEDQRVFLHYNKESDDEGHLKFNAPQEVINTLLAESFTEAFRIVGFCSGLLCLAADFTSSNIQKIVLYNPCIRKFLYLPPHIYKRSLRRNSVLLGFGAHFANGECDFKLVRVLFPMAQCISDIRTVCIPNAEVFSLRDGSWRKIKKIDQVECRALQTVISPILVNGALHWLVFKPNEKVPGNIRPSMLVFDLGTDVLREMALPDAFADGFRGSKGYITKIDNCVAAVRYGYDDEVSRSEGGYNVWVMKRYGDQMSWTRLEHFGLILDQVHISVSHANADQFIMTSQNVVYPLNPLLQNNYNKQLMESGTIDWPITLPISDYMESIALLQGHNNNGVARRLQAGVNASSTSDENGEANGDPPKLRRSKRLKKLKVIE